MKKVILLCLSFFLGASLYAQKDTTWKMNFPRHEVHFTLGDPSYSQIDLYFYRWDIEPGTHQHGWFNSDNYKKYKVTTASASFSYLYRFKKWLWFGADLSYCSYYTIYHDRISDRRTGVDHSQLIHLFPYVRFSWLNKSLVTLYSGIGCGVSLAFEKENANREHFYFNCLPNIQMTFVGVTVGKKWFGISEFGFGPKGIINAGFGYRFNSK